jgi:hypothetical protein
MSSPDEFPTRRNSGSVFAGLIDLITDNLHDAGWSLGWVSALDLEGRTIWIVDAHRNGKRFIVRGDEKLTAFLDLGAATQAE